MQEDGLSWNRASIRIRNQKMQFLRLLMPEGSDLLSVFVADEASRYAEAKDHHLIPLPTGADGDLAFSVDLVYTLQLGDIGGLSTVEPLAPQMDREGWPKLRERLTAIFRTRTRAEWCELMEGSDACFAPVLTMAEAREHPHNTARGSFVEIEGIAQPGPAPRFSRSRPEIQRPPAAGAAHTDEVLRDWGLEAREIERLRETKAIH